MADSLVRISWPTGGLDQEGQVMRSVSGEVATNVVDLTGLSLEELRSSDDPALVRSLALLTGRAECGQTGVLQNQKLDDN